MDTDNDQFLGVVLAKVTQLRHIMMTIYSAKCPELQQDNLTAQRSQSQRARRVEPFEVGGEFRGVDFGLAKEHGHSSENSFCKGQV